MPARRASPRRCEEVALLAHFIVRRTDRGRHHDKRRIHAQLTFLVLNVVLCKALPVVLPNNDESSGNYFCAGDILSGERRGTKALKALWRRSSNGHRWMAQRKWRTEVRRYEGNGEANTTAARFDETEPAATR